MAPVVVAKAAITALSIEIRSKIKNRKFFSDFSYLESFILSFFTSEEDFDADPDLSEFIWGPKYSYL